MNETPNNDTTAEVAELPQCDFCENIAAYDAQVKWQTEDRRFNQTESWLVKSKSWAYFCEEHFISKSNQKLGLGLGQKLILGGSE